MKVVGDEVFEYDMVGKGVMFFSELWHESKSAEDGTVKMALFYKGNAKVKKYIKDMGQNVAKECETSKTYSKQVWILFFVFQTYCV